MDETWLHHYDSETKQKPMTCKRLPSPSPKKSKAIPSACHGLSFLGQPRGGYDITPQ